MKGLSQQILDWRILLCACRKLHEGLFCLISPLLKSLLAFAPFLSFHTPKRLPCCGGLSVFIPFHPFHCVQCEGGRVCAGRAHTQREDGLFQVRGRGGWGIRHVQNMRCAGKRYGGLNSTNSVIHLFKLLLLRLLRLALLVLVVVVLLLLLPPPPLPPPFLPLHISLWSARTLVSASSS